MSTWGEEFQARTRPKRHRWINTSDTHDVVLSEEFLNAAPTGTVLSVLWMAGKGRHFPISVEKRQDGSWAIHSRVGLTSDQLIGARATPRRRSGMGVGADYVSEEALPVPEPVQESTPEARASFAAAASRMAKVSRAF